MKRIILLGIALMVLIAGCAGAGGDGLSGFSVGAYKWPDTDPDIKAYQKAVGYKPGHEETESYCGLCHWIDKW